MSVATYVDRGENVVGLQPDDRMPNDWLRMVARVFAAYRKTPLQTSIVAYVDGFHLSVNSETNDEVIIGITDGQAFVDDQFIGFCDKVEDPAYESSVTVNKTLMIPQDIYYIVLCYTWVNIMPPTVPTFDCISKLNYDANPSNKEHMLILGAIYKDPIDIVLIDDKLPWFVELIQDFLTTPKQCSATVPAGHAAATDYTFNCGDPDFMYHPDFLSVSVNGINLFPGEYTTEPNFRKIIISGLYEFDEIIVTTILPARNGPPSAPHPGIKNVTGTQVMSGLVNYIDIPQYEIDEAFVYINGMRQDPTTYDVVAGTLSSTITFTFVPATGDVVTFDFVV